MLFFKTILNIEKIYVTSNVIFNEATLPFEQIENHSSPNTSPLTSTPIISLSPFVQVPSYGPHLDAAVSNNVLRTPTRSSCFTSVESHPDVNSQSLKFQQEMQHTPTHHR